jgi:hypothetical protein
VLGCRDSPTTVIVRAQTERTKTKDGIVEG